MTILEEYLKKIADSIRSKAEITTKLKPIDFTNEINNMKYKYIVQITSIRDGTVTLSKGTYKYTSKVDSDNNVTFILPEAGTWNIKTEIVDVSYDDTILI